MTVTVTLTFANAADAAAFLAGNAPAATTTKVSAPAPKAAPADTPRTAEAAPAPKADAPASKPLDFKADVIPALQAYSKKVDRETFAALLKKYGVEKVPPLAEKPETWAEIVKTCNA